MLCPGLSLYGHALANMNKLNHKMIRIFGFIKCRRLAFSLIAVMLILSPGLRAQDGVVGQSVGSETGLPIPRFVALKVSDARMRSKPSTDHTILFIYLRDRLPMKVLEEQGDWRRVVDHEGYEGWMKNTILTNDRTFRVIAPVSQMHLRADVDSPVRAELEEGVIGNISLCRADGWCRVSVKQMAGWVRAEDLWGVLENEVF